MGKTYVWKKFVSGGPDIEALNRKRTNCHNAVLASLRAMNRQAEAVGLPPVFTGVISEEQPYRRQAADAVLAFLNTVMEERS